MKINLSPDVERLITEKVNTGRYQSADEVVREGLALLQERETKRAEVPSDHCELIDIADAFAGFGRAISDFEWQKVPPDLSKNLDHYLYGKPKTF